MSSAQYKKEKKYIEEKLQKVRQVVPTVSNNDIILALHNYDLNVERTIQAFLEEGSQGALGDWENTVKSKKSKKKNTSAKDSSTTSSVVDSTTGTLKHQNGKSSSTSSKQNGNNAFTNGYSNGVTSVPATSSATKPKQAPKITTTSNLENLERLNSVEKSKVLSTELSALNRHQTDLNQVQKQFEAEVTNAEASISQCFKEIRQITAERERQLLAALSRVREEGQYYISSRNAELRNLQQTSTNNSDKNEEAIVSELKQFLANKQHDLELGHVTRFLYDNSKLIQLIAHFGEIVAINGSAVQTPTMHSTPSQSNEIKHATSHSSLVSSVGEDSGVGHSPVSREKHVAHVDNGGIKMQSNAISSDQLAEIQRQLAEQLKAQGIDPSVLSGTSSTAPPLRRRPQQQNHHNNKKQSGGGNKKSQKPSIELSILN